MAGVVELNRFIFFGVGAVTPDILIGGFLASLLLLVSGLLIFNRVQRTFVDTI
jgi:ABC-type polysaccharide/polyol phosphate export permease